MLTLPCSISEFARLVGRDRKTVSNWIKAGMPVVGTVKQGVKATIDQPKALKWLYARERDMQSLGAAQLRLLSVRADGQALDNQVKRGEMVLCSIAEQGISAIATLCVSRLEGLPGRLAFEIAAESDPDTINAMLRAEFDAIITAVCRATTDFLDSLKPKLDS